MSRPDRPAYATGVPIRATAACLGALFVVTPTSLQADSGNADPSAGKRQGSFAVGPETGLVIPLSTDRLCPGGAQCIADVGWAVGVGFSYRWPNGLGLGFGYEFWLLTAEGVYEITVPQAFLGLFQVSFLPDRATHPIFRLRGGPLLLGPSFRVETVGGTVEIGAGGEVEISPGTVFSFLATTNLLRTRAFTTSADGALRGTGAALDAMLVLRIGLHFMIQKGRKRGP